MSADPPGQKTDWRDALLEAHRAHPIASSDDGDGAAQLRLLATEGPMIPITDLGPSQHFDEVVRRRRSIRRLGAPLLSDLGVVVARAGLTRHGACTELGNPLTSRPAPSGGARHPLQLVVITATPLHATHRSRAWVLDPDGGVLRRAKLSENTVDNALTRFAEALHLNTAPPAAVVAVGFPHRTLTRYPGGMSLLWRETGALLMLVHLAATDLNLGSSFVGTCGVLYPVGRQPQDPVDLGAVAVGTPKQ